MEFKQIQDLIKQINKSEISEVKIKDKEFSITIKNGKYAGKVQQVVTAPQMMQAAPMAQAPTIEAPTTKETVKEAPEADNLITIKSPMIGTFYRSASPDKPPFIKVGDEISEGKVLCIVEAMKLFNEIEAEVSGKIVKVLVDDASPVEYDTPLFLVEPA